MVKEFKKVFLYKDQQVIDGTITQMGEAAAILNEFIFSVEETMKVNLTDEEKIQVKDNGTEFIKAKIKESFPFPLANESFNLEAIGMLKLESLYQFYNLNCGKWISFNYVLNDKGQFELHEKEIKNTIESFSYYTQNPQQNESLRIAESLVKLFDEAESLGLLNEYGRQHITSVIDLLTVNVHPEVGEYRIMVNKRFLNSKYLN